MPFPKLVSAVVAIISLAQWDRRPSCVHAQASHKVSKTANVDTLQVVTREQREPHALQGVWKGTDVHHFALALKI